jgi:hypothetical protein
MRFFVRQRIAAAIWWALASAIVTAPAGPAEAADLVVHPTPDQPGPLSRCGLTEVVLLVDERGYPTVPARTPYRYCVTGPPLLPGRGIPPPPEYCCH